MTYVPDWVRSMVEEVMGGAPFKIGDVVKHPDGRTVKITHGAYWGDRGVSNWWSWIQVDEHGDEIGESESGYGWRS